MILCSLEGFIHSGGFNYHTKANDFKYRSTILKFQCLIPNFLLDILLPFKLNMYKTEIIVLFSQRGYPQDFSLSSMIYSYTKYIWPSLASYS